MATESVKQAAELNGTAIQYLLGADTARDIRFMLLDAIKAAAEVERLRENIQQAAELGWSSSTLMADCLAPRPIDFDVYQAADMALVLDSLEEAKCA